LTPAADAEADEEPAHDPALRDAKQPRVRLRFEAGASLARQMEILAESVIEDMPRTSAGIRFTTEHHRFASADGVFQEALTAQYARMFDRGAAFFGAFADEMSGTQGCSRS